ncbi:hypothetical protein GCM10010987_64260 [Bradyrhizobium guangdongense]|uniref:Uncharacterized protein n=1 Tax=Bradyrhizobium guangdongense TaxID=1325090 RepID=A0AA87WEM7_9BRAD|nr:hypothetical protein GCM10010987_64260 [Bradyrhizobium guangdongense]
MTAQHKRKSGGCRHLQIMPRFRKDIISDGHNNVSRQADAMTYVKFYPCGAMEVGAYFCDTDVERGTRRTVKQGIICV